MQPKDCYLTTEQKEILKQIAKWLDEGSIPIEWRLVKTFGGTSLMLPHNNHSEAIQSFVNSIKQADYLAFVECGFFRGISPTAYDISRGRLMNAVKDNFGEPMQQPKPSVPQKAYNDLTEEQWNFLKTLLTALKTNQFSPDKRNEKGIYYIKPILNEQSDIVDIEGIKKRFWGANQKKLSISMEQVYQLAELGFLETAPHDNFYVNAEEITEGTKNYKSLQNKNSVLGNPSISPQFQCDIFMVMPFLEDLKPVYLDHIKPIVESLGYTIKRGDDPFSKHDIITEIWSLINNSNLIIADCTGKNANVFYEIGLAHALDKPVVLITKTIEDIPFDVRGKRVIVYEYTPRGMKQFEEELKRAIQSILGES